MNRLYFLSLTALLWLTTATRSYAADIVLQNKSIRLTFDANTGTLLSFYDLKNALEFLDRKSTEGASLWELALFQSKITIPQAGTFHFSRPDAHTLVLEWSRFKDKLAALAVKVTIRLQGEQPFADWNIALSGLSGQRPDKIVFPQISGLQDMGDEELAVPVWLGELYKSPRSGAQHYTWHYPGLLSMQVLSLYNPRTHGFYAACNDAQSYAKSFSISTDSLRRLSYQMEHYPVIAAGDGVYTLPYDAVIGAFKGDWLSAATIYREWAIRQRWCRDSRFRKQAIPNPTAATALWVWNRGRSGNVLTPALDIKQRIGLPVNVLWHWWHGCSYDDGFPEYFPPREGDTAFKSAIDKAREQGVNALVYMNAFQWGTATKSFEAEHALNWAVKDKAGNTGAHIYNIFTQHSLTPMCLATSFWKNKYAALARQAIHDYGTSGIYMDQACLHQRCYDPSHGHSTGGGNYWVSHFGKLTQQIRTQNNTILAGEGCGESWLPYLDAFLSLQVSRERYAGVTGPATIPFFQAVYHDYAITFGSYASLVSPPYDELWPAAYAPATSEQPLPAEFDEQFLMEQARAFVWGQQPTIANYHETLAIDKKKEIDYLIRLVQTRYKSLPYLLYGRFMRPPEMVIPEKNIAVSRLSIYTGQHQDRVTRQEQRVPLLYTGAWKAANGRLGVAVASISEEALPVRFHMRARDYGLPATGKVYVTSVSGRRLLSTYKKGIVEVSYQLEERGACMIEIGKF
ncbi:DUF6259 domain-containing protein [Chitinophaga qingshengii]|uniref:DUF6259 domain-containing protein n=1 Tax=Chitinophaga qingshengii TaxID=1569794 RepID=A0ABR7TWV2_9BACT|nr:DUF6259 domain-containing protein [Chitinophaga qingshengii]MBC9934928.1 hypothetical protein [Chitinophaga qingshengii]